VRQSEFEQLNSRRCLKLPLVQGLETAVRNLQAAAAEAVRSGKKILILSDSYLTEVRKYRTPLLAGSTTTT